MLHEEIDNVRKYIKQLRQPSGRGAMVVVEGSADLIEMSLYSIAERVKALEATTIVQPMPDTSGGNVLLLADFRKNKK